MTTASPGDIFARADELDDYAIDDDLEGFQFGLLDLCRDASKELKKREFSIDAVVLCNEFKRLSKELRLGVDDTLERKMRSWLTRGLELKADVVEAYSRKPRGRA